MLLLECLYQGDELDMQHTWKSNAHKIFIGKPEVLEPPGTSRYKLNYITKMDHS
jgi:hypothetical protein